MANACTCPLSKRCRIVRSLSHGDRNWDGLFNGVISVESPTDYSGRKSWTPINGSKVLKLAEKNEPNNDRQVVAFTIGSPERKKKRDAQPLKMKKHNKVFGEFLKACHLCRKKLDVGKDDLYMYGYLGAFCSIGCRNDQMALDGFDEEFEKEFSAARMEMAERNPLIQRTAQNGVGFC